MRQLGYLGKVPHRGDFVRYNVPSVLHRVWDDWLALVLAEAAESLEDWPAGYDEAPPWRFALSPDLAGEDAHAGVVIASRDAVGRRYPFALFATSDRATTPLETVATAPLLDELERLVGRCVEEAATYEALRDILGELQGTLPEASADDASPVPFRAGTVAHAPEPAVYSEDAELLGDRAGATRLLDAVLRQSSGPYSVWRRREAPPDDVGGLFVTGGLPRGPAAFTLFGADWSTSAGGRLDGVARTDTLRPGEASPDEPTRRVSGATVAPEGRSPSVDGIASPPAGELASSASTAGANRTDAPPTASGGDGRSTPVAAPASGAVPPADRPIGAGPPSAALGTTSSADGPVGGGDTPDDDASDRVRPASAPLAVQAAVPDAAPRSPLPGDAIEDGERMPDGGGDADGPSPVAREGPASPDDGARSDGAERRGHADAPASGDTEAPAGPGSTTAADVEPSADDEPSARSRVDTPPAADEPDTLEIETLDIDDEGGDAPWDR